MIDINGDVIPTIDGEDKYKYLGVPFGAPKRQNIEVMLFVELIDIFIILEILRKPIFQSAGTRDLSKYVLIYVQTLK